MPRRKVTPEEEQKILEDYKNRVEVKDIKKKYNISDGKLKKIRIKHGIDRRGSKVNTHKEEVISRYIAGETCTEIASTLPYSRGVISTFIIKEAKTNPNVIYVKTEHYEKPKSPAELFNKKTPEGSFWLGFMSRKGSLTGNSQLTFLLNERHLKSLEALRDFLGSSHPIKNVREDCVSYRVSSKELYTFLKDHRNNLVARYKKMSEKQKSRFIAGYYFAKVTVFFINLTYHSRVVRITGPRDFLEAMCPKISKLVEHTLNVKTLHNFAYIDIGKNSSINKLHELMDKYAPCEHPTVKFHIPDELNESRGEQEIKKVLQEAGVTFTPQKKFPKLRYKNQLSYDFHIPKLNLLIEYNGKQHYEPVEFFGGQKTYDSQVIRDGIKTKYAKDNNIKLLVIPYTDAHYIRKIVLENLK